MWKKYRDCERGYPQVLSWLVLNHYSSHYDSICHSFFVFPHCPSAKQKVHAPQKNRKIHVFTNRFFLCVLFVDQVTLQLIPIRTNGDLQGTQLASLILASRERGESSNQSTNKQPVHQHTIHQNVQSQLVHGSSWFIWLKMLRVNWLHRVACATQRQKVRLVILHCSGALSDQGICIATQCSKATVGTLRTHHRQTSWSQKTRRAPTTSTH